MSRPTARRAGNTVASLTSAGGLALHEFPLAWSVELRGIHDLVAYTAERRPFSLLEEGAVIRDLF